MQVGLDGVARVLEYCGAAIVVFGALWSTGRFVWDGTRSHGWAYGRYRANLGRGILLGLEFLVAADILATVTAPLTTESVGLLAAVIAIRTFLSFALETEIEGCWPWDRKRLTDKPDR